MKRSSLTRKPRKRTPADPHWNAARGSVCVGCGGRCGPLVQHHIVTAQEVRRRGGAIWDPRNALTLGAYCHAQHHAHVQPIPLVYLPDAALEFAFELLGPAAFDYLGRRYGGDDARLFDPDGNPLTGRWAEAQAQPEHERAFPYNGNEIARAANARTPPGTAQERRS